MERKGKLMNGSSEEILNVFFKEILTLEEKLTDVDCELFEWLEPEDHVRDPKL